MKIIINKNTKMKFKLDLVYLKTGEEFSMNFDTLEDAGQYADWAENTGCRVEQVTLELESWRNRLGGCVMVNSLIIMVYRMLKSIIIVHTVLIAAAYVQ